MDLSVVHSIVSMIVIFLFDCGIFYLLVEVFKQSKLPYERPSCFYYKILYLLNFT